MTAPTKAHLAPGILSTTAAVLLGVAICLFLTRPERPSPPGGLTRAPAPRLAFEPRPIGDAIQGRPWITHLLIVDLDGDGLPEIITGGFHAYPPYEHMSRILLWKRK